MNRNLVTLAFSAALLSGQAFAAEVANWAPDASAAEAYPSLVQRDGSGVSRARVLQTGAEPVLTVNQWTPDGRAVDALPALRQPVTASAVNRSQVRLEVLGAMRSTDRVLDTREGA